MLQQRCKDCDKWEKVDDHQGDCIQEKVDIKGARFWAAKPVPADNPACRGFVARERC